MTARQHIERLIHTAVRAPSGDNSQPWSFRIRNESVDIIAHPDKDHPMLNVENRGTYVAIGALIENLVLVAESDGFHAVVDLFPQDCAARVTFSPGAKENTARAAAISDRHTHRGPYRAEVSPDDIRAISEAPDAHCSIRILSDPEKIRAVAEAAATMEVVALSTKKLHRLFFRSILWRQSDNAAGMPGLYIETTELPRPAKFVFRIIRYWPIMNVLRKIGFPRIAAKSNAAVYAQAGALVAVIIDRNDPSDYIAAGRTMERIWLTATTRHLAAQPLAGLIYLAEYIRKTADSGIAHTLQLDIAKAEHTMRTLFQVPDGSNIAMLLRVGRPIHPAAARTGRMAPRIT